MFYKRGMSGTAIEDCETTFLCLVGVGARNEAAIIGLFYQVGGRDINGKSPVLIDTLEGMSMVLDSHGDRRRSTGGHTCPSISREIHSTIEHSAD